MAWREKRQKLPLLKEEFYMASEDGKRQRYGTHRCVAHRSVEGRQHASLRNDSSSRKHVQQRAEQSRHYVSNSTKNSTFDGMNNEKAVGYRERGEMVVLPGKSSSRMNYSDRRHAPPPRGVASAMRAEERRRHEGNCLKCKLDRGPKIQDAAPPKDGDARNSSSRKRINESRRDYNRDKTRYALQSSANYNHPTDKNVLPNRDSGRSDLGVCGRRYVTCVPRSSRYEPLPKLGDASERVVIDLTDDTPNSSDYTEQSNADHLMQELVADVTNDFTDPISNLVLSENGEQNSSPVRTVYLATALPTPSTTSVPPVLEIDNAHPYEAIVQLSSSPPSPAPLASSSHPPSPSFSSCSFLPVPTLPSSGLECIPKRRKINHTPSEFVRYYNANSTDQCSEIVPKTIPTCEVNLDEVSEADISSGDCRLPFDYSHHTHTPRSAVYESFSENELDNLLQSVRVNLQLTLGEDFPSFLKKVSEQPLASHTARRYFDAPDSPLFTRPLEFCATNLGGRQQFHTTSKAKTIKEFPEVDQGDSIFEYFMACDRYRRDHPDREGICLFCNSRSCPRGMNRQRFCPERRCAYCFNKKHSEDRCHHSYSQTQNKNRVLSGVIAALLRSIETHHASNLSCVVCGNRGHASCNEPPMSNVNPSSSMNPTSLTDRSTWPSTTTLPYTSSDSSFDYPTSSIAFTASTSSMYSNLPLPPRCQSMSFESYSANQSRAQDYKADEMRRIHSLPDIKRQQSHFQHSTKFSTSTFGFLPPSSSALPCSRDFETRAAIQTHTRLPHRSQQWPVNELHSDSHKHIPNFQTGYSSGNKFNGTSTQTNATDGESDDVIVVDSAPKVGDDACRETKQNDAITCDYESENATIEFPETTDSSDFSAYTPPSDTFNVIGTNCYNLQHVSGLLGAYPPYESSAQLSLQQSQLPTATSLCNSQSSSQTLQTIPSYAATQSLQSTAITQSPSSAELWQTPIPIDASSQGYAAMSQFSSNLASTNLSSVETINLMNYCLLQQQQQQQQQLLLARQYLQQFGRSNSIGVSPIGAAAGGLGLSPYDIINSLQSASSQNLTNEAGDLLTCQFGNPSNLDAVNYSTVYDATKLPDDPLPPEPPS